MMTTTDIAKRLGGTFAYDKTTNTITLTLANGQSQTYTPPKRIAYNELLSEAIPELIKWAKDAGSK